MKQLRIDAMLFKAFAMQVIEIEVFTVALKVVVCAQLKIKRLSKARDQLMWILLQFISGSFHKNPVCVFYY